MQDYQYHDHHITEWQRVLILTVFGLINGDITANMQGIKTGIQRAHAGFLHRRFLARNVPNYSTKPLNNT